MKKSKSKMKCCRKKPRDFLGFLVLNEKTMSVLFAFDVPILKAAIETPSLDGKKTPLRLLDTWKGSDTIDAKRESWSDFWFIFTLDTKSPSESTVDVNQITKVNTKITKVRSMRVGGLFNKIPLQTAFCGPFSLGVPEDMSRFAVDVLGAATFGQGFGAIEGGFDDTYRPANGKNDWIAKLCTFLYVIPKRSEFYTTGSLWSRNVLGTMTLEMASTWCEVCPCRVGLISRRHYNVVMQEMLNPLYLTFPVLERLPTPRNIRYKKAVDHMFKVLEGCLPPSESGSGA